MKSINMINLKIIDVNTILDLQHYSFMLNILSENLEYCKMRYDQLCFIINFMLNKEH